MEGQQQHPPPAAAPTNGSPSSINSNLDTALLETIFYNEMMLMDESSSSSDFLAYLSSNESTTARTTPAPIDASTIAERALLSDFGVSSPPSIGKTTAHAAAQPAAAAAAPWPGKHHSVAASPVQQQQPPVAPLTPVATPAAVAPAPVASTAQQQPNTATAVSKERAARLVSQFASLASHLGISLPSNVLASLTDAAALNEEARRAAGEPPLEPLVESSSKKVAPSVSDTKGVPPGPTASSSSTTAPDEPPSDSMAAQLRHTAEAAIAAVNRKRTNDEQQQLPAAGASSSGSSKPLYSKRRKKPRLSDCEAKLASLRAENEMLKHHLDTITNQSVRFEAERKRTEDQMRVMIQEGVASEKLDPVLVKYVEMYSDYGKHRNQELLFHLQQLEKLAAPTNFTKMGLWSLGQSEGFYTNPKQNPIAGILRKELGITPAQGRKILDQRQKIRDVCNNLRECLMLLGKLKALCEHKQKVFHDRMSKCQEILTPPQVAKLLLWVDEHTNLLESVCPGWGSERIRVKEPTKQQPSS